MFSLLSDEYIITDLNFCQTNFKRKGSRFEPAPPVFFVFPIFHVHFPSLIKAKRIIIHNPIKILIHIPVINGCIIKLFE